MYPLPLPGAFFPLSYSAHIFSLFLVPTRVHGHRAPVREFVVDEGVSFIDINIVVFDEEYTLDATEFVEGA